jgi:hypothetical protein
LSFIWIVNNVTLTAVWPDKLCICSLLFCLMICTNWLMLLFWYLFNHSFGCYAVTCILIQKFNSN